MQSLTQIDGNLLLWIQENLRIGFLDAPMRALSFLGNAGMIWIAITLVLLLVKRTRRLGVACACGMLLTLVAVNLTIKPLAARVRPYELIDGLRLLTARATDYSFPSGHSANSFACAWVIFRLEKRRFGVPALLLAALIAWSRLYVGIHYPTDVLAGAAIGILLSEIVVRALPGLERRIKARRRTNPQAKR